MTGPTARSGSVLSEHRANEIAAIPRWMSMLGVTATILPNSSDAPVLIIGRAVGAVAIPLDPGQRAALETAARELELVS